MWPPNRCTRYTIIDHLFQLHFPYRIESKPISTSANSFPRLLGKHFANTNREAERQLTGRGDYRQLSNQTIEL